MRVSLPGPLPGFPGQLSPEGLPALPVRRTCGGSWEDRRAGLLVQVLRPVRFRSPADGIPAGAASAAGPLLLGSVRKNLCLLCRFLLTSYIDMIYNKGVVKEGPWARSGSLARYKGGFYHDDERRRKKSPCRY